MNDCKWIIEKWKQKIEFEELKTVDWDLLIIIDVGLNNEKSDDDLKWKHYDDAFWRNTVIVKYSRNSSFSVKFLQ